MKPIICVLLATMLVACAAPGRQTANFVKGKTTEAMVLADLGPPTNSMTLPDLTRVDVYTHPDAIAAWPSLSLSGLASGTPRILAFDYDANGTLTDMSIAATADVVNTGIHGQHEDQR